MQAAGISAVALLAEAGACAACAAAWHGSWTFPLLKSGPLAPWTLVRIFNSNPLQRISDRLRENGLFVCLEFAAVCGTGNHGGVRSKGASSTCWRLWAEDESVASLCCLDLNPMHVGLFWSSRACISQETGLNNCMLPEMSYPSLQ